MMQSRSELKFVLSNRFLSFILSTKYLKLLFTVDLIIRFACIWYFERVMFHTSPSSLYIFT